MFVWIVLITKLQLVHLFFKIINCKVLEHHCPSPSLKCKVLTRDWSHLPSWNGSASAGIGVGSWSVQLLNFGSYANPDRDSQSQQKLPNTSCHVSNSWARRWWIFFQRSRHHEQEHLGLTWLVFGWINDWWIVRCQRPCTSVDLEDNSNFTVINLNHNIANARNSE